MPSKRIALVGTGANGVRVETPEATPGPLA
jgi:hypothetical protein